MLFEIGQRDRAKGTEVHSRAVHSYSDEIGMKEGILTGMSQGAGANREADRLSASVRLHFCRPAGAGAGRVRSVAGRAVRGAAAAASPS